MECGSSATFVMRTIIALFIQAGNIIIGILYSWISNSHSRCFFIIIIIRLFYGFCEGAFSILILDDVLKARGSGALKEIH